MSRSVATYRNPTYWKGMLAMCQSNAYLVQDDEEELLLEDVVLIEPEGDKIRLTSLFGEKILIDAKVKTVDLLHHKVILEK